MKLFYIFLCVLISVTLISSFAIEEQNKENNNHKLVKRLTIRVGVWIFISKDVIVVVVVIVISALRTSGNGNGNENGNGNVNGLELFDASSDRAYSCFNSENLSIDCQFSKISGTETKRDGSLLTSAIFRFTNGDQTVTFKAGNPAEKLNAVFDDGRSEVNDPETGELWLDISTIEIKGGNPDESAILFRDLKSKSIMALYQRKGAKYNFYDLMMYTTSDTVKNSKGLLIEGVPKESLNTETPRQSDACKGIEGSNEPSLNAEVAQGICNNAIQYDDDLAKSIDSAVDVMNTLKNEKDRIYVIKE